jgi:hypothetical protein
VRRSTRRTRQARRLSSTLIVKKIEKRERQATLAIETIEKIA